MARHRLLYCLIDRLAPYVFASNAVLDIAPFGAGAIRRQVRSLVGDRYVSVDLTSKQPVDLAADLRALPFPDGCFDFAICYHVLEHIEDDAAAIAELGRVMSAGGLLIVQVPIRRGRPTEEDPAADPVERARRFGQADHVRFYGEDFEDRLRVGGLDSTRLWSRDLLSREELERFAITSQPIWLCRTATGRRQTSINDGALIQRVP